MEILQKKTACEQDWYENVLEEYKFDKDKDGHYCQLKILRFTLCSLSP